MSIDVTLRVPTGWLHLGDSVYDVEEGDAIVGRIIGLGTNDGVVPFVVVKWLSGGTTENFIGDEIGALKRLKE